MSKTPQKFGRGSEEGIVASEAANNATVRSQGRNRIVSFNAPNMKSQSGQPSVVVGTINNDNLVTKVLATVPAPRLAPSQDTTAIDGVDVPSVASTA